MRQSIRNTSILRIRELGTSSRGKYLKEQDNGRNIAATHKKNIETNI